MHGPMNVKDRSTFEIFNIYLLLFHKKGQIYTLRCLNVTVYVYCLYIYIYIYIYIYNRDIISNLPVFFPTLSYSCH